MVNFEESAPEHPLAEGFNHKARVPFSVKTDDIRNAMLDFTKFLEFVDAQLCGRQMARFEEMLMPANCSSMAGEFMTATIPKYCSGVVKNTYHNGHPDLLPARRYASDACQHAGADGIEVKASRYLKSWQGHNAEDVWLIVFMFQAGRPNDAARGVLPVRFRFLEVLGALLSRDDWKFAGRSETSRRTITASVTRSGYEKLRENWINRVPGLSKQVESKLIAFHEQP
jgi:hypothetical protein